MVKKISFKVEDGFHDEIVELTYDSFCDNIGDNIYCYYNDKCICEITCFIDTSDNFIYLEYWYLYEEYRGKGYGTELLKSFKSTLKDWGFKYITGSCKSELIHFYEKAGAVFENRTDNDKTILNNVFYIDLQ